MAGSLGAVAAALVAVAGDLGCSTPPTGQGVADQRLAGRRGPQSGRIELRLALLNFERGQAACEKGEIGPGLLRLVESWRSAVAAGDPAWQHAARANLAAWQRQYPRLKAVFSHARRGHGVRRSAPTARPS